MDCGLLSSKELLTVSVGFLFIGIFLCGKKVQESTKLKFPLYTVNIQNPSACLCKEIVLLHKFVADDPLTWCCLLQMFNSKC